MDREGKDHSSLAVGNFLPVTFGLARSALPSRDREGAVLTAHTTYNDPEE